MPENEEPEAEAKAAAPPSMVQFDGAGQAIDLGKRSVFAAGFLEGSTIALNPKSVADQRASGRDQWQLLKINLDGSVLITKINSDGKIEQDSTTSVGLPDFLGNYKQVVRIELDTRGPVNNLEDWENDLFQNAAFNALFRKRNAVSEEGIVRYQSKPTKALFALRSWTADGTVSIPLTTARHLKLLDLTTDEPPTFVITVDNGDGKKKSFAMGRMSSKEYMSLAFEFKSIDEEEKANLKLGEVKVSVPMWALPNCPKFEVTLPLVAASKNIQAEDEMVLYIPKAKKEPKRKAKDVDLDVPETKKQKDAGSSTSKKEKKAKGYK